MALLSQLAPSPGSPRDSEQPQENSSLLAALSTGLTAGELQLGKHKEMELLFLIRPLLYDLSKFLSSFVMMVKAHNVFMGSSISFQVSSSDGFIWCLLQP